MIVEREFFKDEQIITPEQIEIISGMDSEAAEREFCQVIKALGTQSEELLMLDYCLMKGYEAEEVFFCLYPPQDITAASMLQEVYSGVDPNKTLNYDNTIGS